MVDVATLDIRKVPGVAAVLDAAPEVTITDVEILNVSEPTAASSAATKNYVDTNGLGADPVNHTTSTLAVTQALHAGKVVTLNLAAGIAVTLPAATATGDVYTFVVGTTFTGASTIKVPAGSDSMIGNATLYANAGDTVVGFAAAAADDTIDLLGTANSTGGLLGGIYVLRDIGAALWHINITSDAAGTEATPFSATVS